MDVLIIEKMGRKFGVLFRIQSKKCSRAVRKLARRDKLAAVSCTLRNGHMTRIVDENEMKNIDVSLKLTETGACGDILG